AQLERIGFEAGVAQLSGRLGIPEEEVKAMGERVLKRDISLNQPMDLNENKSLLDFQSNASEVLPDEQIGLREELELLREHLEKLRPQLNEREIFLLEKRLLAEDPITLQDFGNRYGVTREAARQLEVRLIDKIKKQMMARTE